MNTLTGYWTRMDMRQRGTLVGGLAALAVILVILTRVATSPSYAMLYSGLDPAAAGEVVEAIAARGVLHRIDGDTILVEATERDALRLALASEGLPANGPQGYELLDQLSGFGTTSQMFDAAFWRAREGELARTILSSPAIRAARVHIANPSSDPFQPTRDVTASIAIRAAAGGLAPGHAQALRYLVASSVPGLSPDNVTVVDADSGQVLGGHDQMTPATDAAGRAEAMRQSIERLLAARVGPGNAMVQVSVELETAHEMVIERVIDPESRVIVATETEDRENTSRDAPDAGVTVASNLATGDAAGGGESSSAAETESRERVTFDMSELQRETERVPGDIRRISVAVLLNGVETIGADGISRTDPRPEAEIAALTLLVQSAIGFDADRGDAVTVQSMAFDAAAITGLEAATLVDRLNIDLGRIAQTALLSVVALAIAFGLLRPLLSRASQSEAVPRLDREVAATVLPPPIAARGATLALPGATRSDATTEIAESRPDAVLAPPGALSSASRLVTGTDRGFSGTETGRDDPVDRLRRLIEEREEETVEILRSWMEEEEELSR